MEDRQLPLFRLKEAASLDGWSSYALVHKTSLGSTYLALVQVWTKYTEREKEFPFRLPAEAIILILCL